MSDLTKRDTPQWAEGRVTTQGGRNRYGQPNFRIIWGGNRFHLIGGKFKKVVMVDAEEAIPIIGQPKRQVPLVTEVAEMRWLHKYYPHRWWLEKWCPPELYGSPEDWYESTWDPESELHILGPYPERGDYEPITYLGFCGHMKPGDKEWCGLCRLSFGEYLSLEAGIDVFEWHIWALEQSANTTAGERRSALFDREIEKKKEYRNRATEIVKNAMRPAYCLEPCVQMANPSAPRSTPEAKFHIATQYDRHRDSGLKQF